MGRYRLKGGLHIQADPKKPPRKVMDARGNEVERPASTAYKVGQVVESDVDLVATQGADRWEYADGGREEQNRIRDLEKELAETRAQLAAAQSPVFGGLRVAGDPTPEVAEENPAVFPGGQVSTGFQGSVGGGKSGAITPETAAAHSTTYGDAGKQEGGLFADKGDKGVKASKGAKSDADLEAMHVADLKDHAANEEIELHGAHTKAEMISAIKKGQKAKK